MDLHPITRGDGSELLIVGQFALRRTFARRTASVAQPPRLPLIAPPAASAAPCLPSGEAVAPSPAPWRPTGPTLLPTEAYLALRSATARHREAAYASV